MFSSIETFREMLISNIETVYSKKPRHELWRNIVDKQNNPIVFSKIENNIAVIYTIKEITLSNRKIVAVCECENQQKQFALEELNTDVLYYLYCISNKIYNPIKGFVPDEYVML